MKYLVGLACVVTAGCGATAPAPHEPAPKAACAAGPAVIHIAAIPPRAGETLHYEQTATYELTVGHKPRAGASHFVTTEKIESVDDDTIEALDVTFVEGKWHPDDTKPAVDVTGKHYLARREGENMVFFEGDARAPEDVEHALATYAREDVGRPHPMLALFTDATFKLGEEVHLDPESARGSKGRPEDARITLRKVEGDRATFDFVLREKVDDAPLISKGVAVVDTAHARLVSTDYLGELDVSVERLRAAGVNMKIAVKERYDYGTPSSAGTADCEPHTTLHIPWIPPRVGERFTFEQKLVADWTFKNPQTNRSVRIRGGWETETDERVVEVGNGVITALEADVKKDIVQPIQRVESDDRTPPSISRSGDKLEIRAELPKLIFKRNGVEVDPKTDVATQVLYRADVPLRFWVTRMVTDRTFEVGVESRYSNELIIPFGKVPSEARIMLASIEDRVAHFKLDIKTKLDVNGRTTILFMRGDLDFDIKRARPLAVSLKGDFDVAEGIERDGLYTLDYRFQYPE